MAKKEVFRHYGYFEGEIAKRIFGKNADEIVVYLMDKPEDFNINKPSCDDDTEIIYPDCICDGFQFEKNTGGYYLVRYERGNNNNEDWFIDVYSLKTDYETENDDEPESDEEGVYEYCPHCDDEVILENVFKVQKCPNCGKYIVPCNLCPLLGENKCTGNCPLEALANELNKDKREYGVEYSIGSFVSEFNSSTEKQWEKGFILTIFNDDGFIDIVLRIFYIKSLDTICFMNERDSDKGWFMREPKRLSIDYLEHVFEVLDIPSNYKLYVKVLN
jgi:predicted RNA-binding Zn-ribbon protein involved in translation (DUF1610 family)